MICLVQFLYWEATQKILRCKDCRYCPACTEKAKEKKIVSVLVRGMKMPENCKVCRIDGRECSRWQAFDLWKFQRAPDCPLLAVSEHGDLIDQEEYREEFMNGVYDLCADDPDNRRANAIIDLFDSAPVVIPAERDINVPAKEEDHG